MRSPATTWARITAVSCMPDTVASAKRTFHASTLILSAFDDSRRVNESTFRIFPNQIPSSAEMSRGAAITRSVLKRQHPWLLRNPLYAASPDSIAIRHPAVLPIVCGNISHVPRTSQEFLVYAAAFLILTLSASV